MCAIIKYIAKPVGCQIDIQKYRKTLRTKQQSRSFKKVISLQAKENLQQNALIGSFNR
jgi:hypothetical protein